ncbi:hypothetical protein A3Q56_05280 [Intoshia linei]|uniref:VWFA domain-containing protein n=1 Tax=Intoshia linei TaxID=1819745 RepID=A0A177AYC5_9BILA|nr:hypothetical protein A3Q56_05280 [Intoshia linei]
MTKLFMFLAMFSVILGLINSSCTIENQNAAYNCQIRNINLSCVRKYSFFPAYDQQSNIAVNANCQRNVLIILGMLFKFKICTYQSGSIVESQGYCPRKLCNLSKIAKFVIGLGMALLNGRTQRSALLRYFDESWGLYGSPTENFETFKQTVVNNYKNKESTTNLQHYPIEFIGLHTSVKMVNGPWLVKLKSVNSQTQLNFIELNQWSQLTSKIVTVQEKISNFITCQSQCNIENKAVDNNCPRRHINLNCVRRYPFCPSADEYGVVRTTSNQSAGIVDSENYCPKKLCNFSKILSFILGVARSISFGDNQHQLLIGHFDNASGVYGCPTLDFHEFKNTLFNNYKNKQSSTNFQEMFQSILSGIQTFRKFNQKETTVIIISDMDYENKNYDKYISHFRWPILLFYFTSYTQAVADSRGAEVHSQMKLIDFYKLNSWDQLNDYISNVSEKICFHPLPPMLPPIFPNKLQLPSIPMYHIINDSKCLCRNESKCIVQIYNRECYRKHLTTSCTKSCPIQNIDAECRLCHNNLSGQVIIAYDVSKTIVDSQPTCVKDICAIQDIFSFSKLLMKKILIKSPTVKIRLTAFDGSNIYNYGTSNNYHMLEIYLHHNFINFEKNSHSSVNLKCFNLYSLFHLETVPTKIRNILKLKNYNIILIGKFKVPQYDIRQNLRSYNAINRRIKLFGLSKWSDLNSKLVLLQEILC